MIYVRYYTTIFVGHILSEVLESPSFIQLSVIVDEPKDDSDELKDDPDEPKERSRSRFFVHQR